MVAAWRVVAVERFVFLAGLVAAAVPPGRFGVRAAPIIVAVAVAVAVAVWRWWLGVVGGWLVVVGALGAGLAGWA